MRRLSSAQVASAIPGSYHVFSHINELFEDNMSTLSTCSAEWLEGLHYPTSESLRLSQLALPHYEHTPAQLFKFSLITPVSEDV